MPNDEALASEAEALLRAADEAIARQDWPAAGRHIDRALQRVGDRYLSLRAIDSSGQTLVLADIEAAQGRESSAIAVRRGVLHSRTVQLREKLRPPSTPSTFPIPGPSR
ncbi:hypothetical protein SAMN05443579_101493 [Variovorax sp. PDC80]|uniref:hypothetical protein n=1 Tax=Variovorax sp. PDC80 TaxID=1882827 RepID=UPI0008EB0973|nr:hypothetical protein [Variovorax sp. PDC80]SFO05807.1 hypothetical protein SAMN05443579_101493 [Variovorax sp. PDC80]